MTLVVALSLGACTPAPPPPPDARDRALQEAIQAPQDKARAVEDELMEAKRQQDARIEEQGG
jgi:hypothetical protein